MTCCTLSSTVLRASSDRQFGIGRLFVVLIDTGEALDETSPGLLVQTLHIALFTHFEGRGHVTLEELEARLLVDLASTAPCPVSDTRQPNFVITSLLRL
jgi:hypothetical protein